MHDVDVGLLFEQFAHLRQARWPQAWRCCSRCSCRSVASPTQIERFRALLDGRFRRREPLTAYAGALGISVGQLTRLCRERLGCSAQAAVNARVVHEAQRELVYSSLSIKQVAAALGFDDEAYFGRFFKKQTGWRPTDFREMARRQLAAA